MADVPNTEPQSPPQADNSSRTLIQTAKPPLSGGNSPPATGQQQMHRTTVGLAYITTIGFFSLIVILIVLDRMSVNGQNPPPNSPYRDILLTLMGIVGTAWAGIISFYFGSSVGARAQSDTLQQISRNAAAPRTDDH
jgi:Mn2+/Fe2+ NRAMP family transporter